MVSFNSLLKISPNVHLKTFGLVKNFKYRKLSLRLFSVEFGFITNLYFS